MKTRLLTVSIALLISQLSLAQASNEKQVPGGNFQAGFGNLTQFGGPESVGGALRQGDKERESIFQWNWADRNLKPYFDWKRDLNDKQGLALGFQMWTLYQHASSSLANEDDDAFGGIFRFQGSWTPFRSDSDNVGRIEYRLESRGGFGNFQAPSSMGPAVGAAALNPGFGYSEDFGLEFSALNWTQSFMNNRIGYAVGRLVPPAYLDAGRFTSFNSGLLNRAFFINPALATTGVGALGAVAKGYLGDHLWFGAHIYDANAVTGEFDFDTVQEGEWFKAVEVGFMPTFADRNDRHVQATYWEKDARKLADTPAGHGWAITALYQFTEKYLAFVKIGRSNGGGGAPAEEAVSGGIEIRQRLDQVWSIGVGWAKPSEKVFGLGLSNETVLETSYKFQLSRIFSFTPDLEVIFNPAKDPSENTVWVIGVRLGLAL